MATRSRIAIENENGTINSIYCHWDGYIENNGVLLYENYSDRTKLQELIDLGDISSLAENIKTDEVHTWDNPKDGIVRAYHRDRGEDFNSKSYDNIEELFDHGFDTCEEYVYCYTKNDEWVVKQVGEKIESLKIKIDLCQE